MEWHGDEDVEACHIARLPNEILTEVLVHVSTRQLLRCRGVSSLWNQLASSLCRQRHVHLPQGACDDCLGDDEEDEDDLRLDNKLCIPCHVLDVTSAPWSAIQLDFPLVTCGDEEVLTDIPVHFDTTLSLMTMFTATLTGGQDDVLFFRVLERMPSLKKLHINTPEDCSPHPDFKPSDDMTLDLSTLKELDIEFVTETSCHLLDFILTRPFTSVRHVKLRLSPWEGVEEDGDTVFSRVWSLVKDMESVTLSLTYSGPTTSYWSTLLVEPRPNLKRLVIDSGCFLDGESPPPSQNHFKVLEEYLAKCCQHLENLSLIGFNVVAAAGECFQQRQSVLEAETIIAVEVPALPNLRHLHILSNGGLHHFSAQPFPNLRSVHLQCGYFSDASLDLAAAFGASGVFSTVRVLELNGFNGTGNWGMATAFPNLKVMSVKVTDADQLSAAFSAAIGLDQLTIDFDPDEGEDGIDLTIFKGLTKVPPGTELKKLVVKAPTDNGFGDYSAILFNVLKPLRLVLWNSQNLSENILSQLRNYHTALHLEED